MNQSTVKHTEIGLRLTICSEFLLDEEKSVEELYRKWMRRVGGQIIEFAEFEYWCRRFQNNQFDLGYDTSLDSKEISEIQNTMNSEAGGVQNAPTMIEEKKTPVEVVQRQTEDLKLNHQFNEENMPEAFKTLINRQAEKVSEIGIYFDEQIYTISVDTFRIDCSKNDNDWMIRYPNSDTVIKTDDPEKSIIDHLWFVLKNPNIKLEYFEIYDQINSEIKPDDLHFQRSDFEKLNKLMQSMLNTFDHQIHTSKLQWDIFNEDTFFSMLQHVESGTLEGIKVKISWKQKGNYQKMKEIVETDQWKQAKVIISFGATPLKIDDLFQHQRFSLELDSITLEDVLRVTEHAFSSEGNRRCLLKSKSKCFDLNALINFLRLHIEGSQITNIQKGSYIGMFSFDVVKSDESIFVEYDKYSVAIHNY